MQTSSIEALEEKVDAARALLQRISQCLQESPSDTTAYYCAKAVGLLEQSMETRSIIGIFGATGAGKSALMNAILDEESLLPTNCMRACTAVVTEISYNSSSTPYRATIEFISKSAWERELDILIEDVLDDTVELSRESNKNNTDAALAWSKLQAVYPDVTKDVLKGPSGKQFLVQEATDQLDKLVDIEENDPVRFRNNLRLYIDSREKSRKRQNAQKDDGSREREAWPLIRVVRIYLKCDVLKHGVVLVDLPGVHDSNAARAAVAKDYQKQCNAFFVVSTITRAVDDMSAKVLLSDAFKRQLKLDGQCSDITFICTQTDNISLTEMSRHPDISDCLIDIDRTIEECDSSIASLDKEHNDLQQSLSTIVCELELAEGKVSETKPNALSERKRRRDSPMLGGRKKRSLLTSATEVDSKGLDDEIETRTDVEVEHHRDLQKDKSRTLEKINTNRLLLAELEDEKRMSQRKVAQMCIKTRNTDSRQSIKRALAMEVKALDQQVKEYEDPQNFDPNVEIRNYEELEEGFTVFCVSSRAYQKLRNRLSKENAVQGFNSIEDTELPQLQAHCSSAAKSLRVTALEKWIIGFDDFCRSLKVWECNSSGLAIKSMSNNDIEAFANSFTEHCKTAMGLITNDVSIHFHSKISEAVRWAQNEAVPISARWGRPPNADNREEGGLHWQTYRAVVLRDGRYANSNGVYDFNYELTAPLINRLMHHWETVFFKLIPSTFEKVLLGFETFLKGILAGINNICRDQKMLGNLIHLLEQQFDGYLVKARHLFDTAYTAIIARQREINRSFEPVIVNYMLQTYAECAAETGKGTFARMRTDMNRGVSQGQVHMYHKSASLVRDMLNDMLETTNQQLQDHALELCKDIKQDCTGLQAAKNKHSEDLQKPVRKDLARMIHEYELDMQSENDYEDSESDHDGSIVSDEQSEDFNGDVEASDSEWEDDKSEGSEHQGLFVEPAEVSDPVGQFVGLTDQVTKRESSEPSSPAVSKQHRDNLYVPLNDDEFNVSDWWV